MIFLEQVMNLWSCVFRLRMSLEKGRLKSCFRHNSLRFRPPETYSLPFKSSSHALSSYAIHLLVGLLVHSIPCFGQFFQQRLSRFKRKTMSRLRLILCSLMCLTNWNCFQDHRLKSFWDMIFRKLTYFHTKSITKAPNLFVFVTETSLNIARFH